MLRPWVEVRLRYGGMTERTLVEAAPPFQASRPPLPTPGAPSPASRARAPRSDAAHTVGRELRTVSRGLHTVGRGLRTARRELHTASRELRTARRGLRTASRELRTVSRGLHTVGRELRTARRELHTVGRGLRTARRELHTVGRGLRTARRELRYRRSTAHPFRAWAGRPDGPGEGPMAIVPPPPTVVAKAVPERLRSEVRPRLRPTWTVQDMKDVSARLRSYRECVRHLWNTHFLEVVGGSADKRALRDPFDDVCCALFGCLVVEPLGLLPASRAGHLLSPSRSAAPGIFDGCA